MKAKKIIEKAKELGNGYLCVGPLTEKEFEILSKKVVKAGGKFFRSRGFQPYLSIYYDLDMIPQGWPEDPIPYTHKPSLINLLFGY